MKSKIITKKEIDTLYKKVGVSDSYTPPSNNLNLGTMRISLVSQFEGARGKTSMLGDLHLK